MELYAAANKRGEERPEGTPFGLAERDPEFSAIFSRFAYDEVLRESKLDGRTRFLAILAALMGCQGLEAFLDLAPAALREGVTPEQLKELLYQGTAYLGLGRVLPFLRGTNRVLEARGVSLPLPHRGLAGPESRAEAGNRIQVDIFGEGMRDFHLSGPEESRHINRWLAANCFGDYYTREGLDCRQRELITFCFLAAQGGCEPQLVSHAAGNLRMGNDKAVLIDVLSQCIPYIGYPRALNALRCVNEAAS